MSRSTIFVWWWTLVVGMLMVIESSGPEVPASASGTVSGKGVGRPMSPMPRPARLRQPALSHQ